MNSPDSLPLSLNPVPAPSARAQLTARVKMLAARHGLSVSAITSAEPFPDVAAHLDWHIEAGHVAGLDWFTHERARFSTDARNLQPSAQSILSVGISYWPGPTQKPDDGIPRGRISRYAWGRDYHRVIKRRLKLLHADLERELDRPIESRLLVDTARIVDRAVAARAGLGWYGKNSLACFYCPPAKD